MNRKIQLFEILTGQAVIVAICSLIVSARSALLREDWIGVTAFCFTACVAIALTLAFFHFASIRHKPNLVQDTPLIAEIEESFWLRNTKTYLDEGTTTLTEIKINLPITIMSWIVAMAFTIVNL